MKHVITQFRVKRTLGKKVFQDTVGKGKKYAGNQHKEMGVKVKLPYWPYTAQRSLNHTRIGKTDW